jgi:ArsR family transcriptional regulator
MESTIVPTPTAPGDAFPASGTGAQRAVAALAALAQPTRLAIFRLLVEHAGTGLTPGAIASRLDLAPATLSFHLKELAGAGLIADRREGRNLWYCPDVAAMNALIAYLTDHCCRASGGTACVPECAPAACAPEPTRARSPR